MKDLLRAFSPKKSFACLFVRPQKGYYAIDGVRAFSIVWVVILHAFSAASMFQDRTLLGDQADNAPWYFGWVWNGHFAIDAFFIISGFLIAGLLFHEYGKDRDIKMSRFYLRRFMRLMPAYVFCVVIFYLANMPNKEYLWVNLLYLNNFLPPDMVSASWTWSLAVEEQFYLLLPAIMLFVLPRTNNIMRWIVGGFLFSILIRFIVVINDDILRTSQVSAHLREVAVQEHFFTVLYDNLYTRFGAFLGGIGCVYLYLYQRQKCEKYLKQTFTGHISIVASIIILIALALFNVYKSDIVMPDWLLISYYGLVRHIFTLAFSIILLAVLIGHPVCSPIKWFLSLRLWYPFAQLTYSAYLIHPVWVAVVTLNMKANYEARNLVYDYNDSSMLLLSFFIVLVLTYISAFFIYITIERPFINYRDLRSRIKSTDATPAFQLGLNKA